MELHVVFLHMLEHLKRTNLGVEDPTHLMLS